MERSSMPEEMRMIAEKADMEGRSNKWMGGEGILMVHEAADKPVPVTPLVEEMGNDVENTLKDHRLMSE